MTRSTVLIYYIFIRQLCQRLDIPVENEDWNTAESEEVLLLLQDLLLDPLQGQYGWHSFEDSPFMYLAQEGRPEILRLLFSRHPCMEKYSDEEQQLMMSKALHKAVQHHRLDNATVLLNELNAQLEWRDEQGRTAFLMACGHDQPCALYLLEKGGDINVKDVEGLGALHWAACSGFMETCCILIDRGIPVETRAKLGATPLMVASSGRRHSIVKMFLDQGSDVNACTPDGWTALHVAVRACAPVIVHTLLQHGANPNAQSSRLTHNSDVVPASTPLLIAIALNSMRVIRHLLNANCDISMPGLACTWPSLSSSESDDDIKYQKKRCTPIQYAILSRAWDVAELLLKAGCEAGSVRSWLDLNHSPVHIPDDRLRQLRLLIQQSTTLPPKLKFLCRRSVREILGRQLVEKLEKLEGLPQTCREFILYHDLFRPTEGSFEV